MGPCIRGISVLFVAALAGLPVAAEERRVAGEEAIEVIVEAPRVANEEPAAAYAAPVSALRYDPLVDVQARNLAEAQSDLVIRGGTFETSGVRIGGVPLLDPQTGHYLLEIPFDPHMLDAPARLTGLENAVAGFNNGSGSVAWGLRPIEESASRGRLGGGSDKTFVGEAYTATLLGDGSVGCDLGAAHSRTNGSIEGGDSDFSRVSGRCQLLTDESQTDLVAGYQEKSFSWPYLYALRELHELVGSAGLEYESLHTTTTLLNHRREYEADSFVEVGASWRRNSDNYEFDRARPGLFNPFEHTTETSSVSVHGDHWADRVGFRYGAQGLYEELDSTSLTFNPWLNRSRWRGALVPQYEVLGDDEDRSLVLGAGVGYEDSNRAEGRLSPLAEARYRRELSEDSSDEVVASVTQLSQLPGFTALASNPVAGLFRGNQSLEETLSTTYEIGSSLVRGELRGDFAVFHRTDRNLVDWTYTENVEPFSARTANNVDVDVTGTELLVGYDTESWAVLGGYFYTHKDAAYATEVDASFYALNFPRHRLSGAIMVRPVEPVEVRFDLEWRDQEPNELRSSADETYTIGSLSARYRLPVEPDLGVSLIVDNLWNEQFEEVPGVPGFGRSFGVFLTGAM